MNIHLVRNSLNATFSKSQKSHYVWCMVIFNLACQNFHLSKWQKIYHINFCQVKKMGSGFNFKVSIDFQAFAFHPSECKFNQNHTLRIMHKIATFCTFWINLFFTLFAQWVQDSFLFFFLLWCIYLFHQLKIYVNISRNFRKTACEKKRNNGLNFISTHFEVHLRKTLFKCHHWLS